MHQQPVSAADHPSHHTNLPVRREMLIGREADVAMLRQLLLRQDVGLVSVTGAGGIGKTRLALQVAADLLDEFRNGVYLVPLSPLRDPELVPSAIAGVLGIEEAGDQPLVTGLRTYLRDRHILLLLDNFEHLLGAAPFVAELLSVCPLLTVMVTSRVVLRVSGEHEFQVSPLELPDLRQPLDPDMLARTAAIKLFL